FLKSACATEWLCYPPAMKAGTATMPEALSECKYALVRALLSVFVNGLGSDSPAVRRKAAHRLGELGRAATPAIPHLEELLTDQDRKVREAAEDALGRIGGSDPGRGTRP